jgi:hypothetical protein
MREVGKMKKIFWVILIGFILITPVFAETGSISVLADPNNFVPTYKVKTEPTIGIFADEKMVVDIQPFPFGLKEVLQINPIQGKDYSGVSAQNIRSIMPSLVYQNPDMVRFVEKGKELDPMSGMQYTAPSGTYTLSVDTNGIIAALVNAIKEQQATIEAQQNNITKLEERIVALEKKVGV